jgi:EAL domain-containing protein (putative c-di-GMP-specific phosphodiesterase class I)
MAAPFAVSGHTMTVSASIGIAIADDECTATTLLRDADMAMYQVKGNGRASWMVFDPLIRVRTLERLQIEQDLARAVDRGQLRVAYQPVVALASGALVGFEALLRWEHPILGDIAPDRFIPIAEATGTIDQIGRWVLDVACQHLARWRRDHPAHRDLSMAVNVSAHQLASSDLLGDVAAALNGAGLPASALVIEMTETSLIHDPVATARRLHQLHQLGIRLAIDDFGTGFSSLSYLRQFPVDILKLDRSFVSTITSDGSVPALLHGLIELGHTLDLQLIAEGVETEAQLVALHRERCQLGQGYLFAAAMDPPAVVDLLQRTEPQPLTAPNGENALRERRASPIG